MNIADWLYQTARIWPDRAAVYDGDVLRHDYAGLMRAVVARAYDLTARGICRGDRVAVFGPNAPEYIEILHACWWIGAVVVPVNHKLHPREA